VKAARKPIVLSLLLILISSPLVYAENSTEVGPSSASVEEVHLFKQKLQTSEEVAQKSTNAPINSEKASEVGSLSLVRLFQGLAFCLGVFFIGIHIYRKYILKSAPVSQRSMRLIERLSLNGKSSLYLVEVEKKKILVAVGAEKLSMIESDQFSDLNNASFAFELPADAKIVSAPTKGKACAA